MSTTTRAPKSGASSASVRVSGVIIAALSITAAVLVSLPWPRGVSRFIPSEIGGIALLLAMIVTLVVVWRTRATGGSPVWIGAIVVGIAAGLVAGVSSPIIGPSERFDVSDAAFLLAGVMSYVVSIGILAAGRWRGAARYLPIAAHSWPIIAFTALLAEWPEGWSWYGPIGTLVLLHAALGIVLAVRPSLTEPTTVSK